MAFKPNSCLAFGLLISVMTGYIEAYFGDWSTLGGRPNEPTCVDIPKNMSLCADIGYDKMRLPNLLDHDTLAEVQQQAGSWVPLLNVRCHPSTKLFLCSLFTPVCLENQIYPCKSLCEKVQRGCEVRMKTYGYDWPPMLNCDKFPEDNDMCIKGYEEKKVQATKSEDDDYCSVCSPVDTYENVLDNFCRSDFVIRARIKRQRGPRVTHRKIKIFKSAIPNRKHLRRSKMLLEGESACCSFIPGKQKYLIMGHQKGFVLRPTFVLPWKRTKALQKAVRMFPNLDCKDPNLFTPTLTDGKIVPEPRTTEKKQKTNRRKKNKDRRRKKWKDGKKKKSKQRADRPNSRRRKNQRRRNKKKEMQTKQETVDK